MRCRHEETIIWIDPDDELPDDEMQVLVFTPDANDPVGLAYLIDGIWHCGLRDNYLVVAWAEMPSGPPKRETEE